MSSSVDMNLTGQFERDQNYHFKCLQQMFRLHYQTWCVKGIPISKRQKNKYWTLHVSEPVMFVMRLHLAWMFVGENVFLWSRIQIGKKILRLFQKRKVLHDLIEIVRRDETILNMYMECEI